MGEAGNYSGGPVLRFAAGIATLAASCALAAVVAWWGWQLLGPAPVHVVPATPTNPAAAIIAANLFGSGGGAATAATGASGATLAGDARLLGIIAEPQRQGYALFGLPGGAKVVMAGQEVSPGVKVTAILPDTVVLEEGAIERRLSLRPQAGAGTRTGTGAVGLPTASKAAGVPSAATDAAAVATASCAPPRGFHGAVIRLNAELVGGLRNDAASWRRLLAATPQGLVVTQENGYAAMLGLKAGDRIAQANGIALRNPDDLNSAVLRPLIANQGVRIVGVRGNAPHELWLANTACAG